ncbi:MAG: PA14 domain-containing protein, partial [bacterium]
MSDSKKTILLGVRGRRPYPWILTFAVVLQWVAVSVSSADSGAPVILSGEVVTPPMNPIPSQGDLWMNTWADDGHIYTGWGDGKGPGDIRPWTDCGVGVLKGTVPYFLLEEDPNNYVRSKFVPDGQGTERNDKPSSLLLFDGRLYFAGHTPLGDPDYGYIAYSDDYGLTWVEVPGSPWTKENQSVFRCLFFINMGKDYELNDDGYVHALGIGKEWSWFLGRVYLARVPKSEILDYGSYEYFAGSDGGGPLWSADQFEATPLEGLETHDMGSAMYHEGIERYLFLTDGGLFEAPNPWGPWTFVNGILNGGDDPEWKGGYMPGVMAKGAGADYFYFTLAGQSQIIRYYLYVGKISLQLNSEIEAQASADTTIGVAPLQVQFQGAGDASGGTIISYRWYFGDGAISTDQNPSHVYTSPTYGTYRAMLTVTDDQGRRGFDIVEITVPFCELTLREPEDPDSCSPGFLAKYYDLPPEGGEQVPDFSTMTPYKIDTVPQLNYSASPDEFATSGRADSLAALFTGYVSAPVDGIYTFYLLSDDASELHIGDEEIIDNNGEHEMQMRERAGQIGLKAGKHALRVGYTEIDQLCGLRLQWEGPGFPREFVPDSRLCHSVTAIKGDVNGDGAIDVLDVVMVVNIILEIHDPTPG